MPFMCIRRPCMPATTSHLFISLYIKLSCECSHACGHVGVPCIICFAQEGAAKQTRTSICLGKPGFRDRPTNPCVLQVSDKTRRRTFGDPGRSAKPWIISRLSFLGLCAGKAVSQHSAWQKIQGWQKETNGGRKKTGGFRQTAGLDSTPCGNSVEMLMIFYG